MRFRYLGLLQVWKGSDWERVRGAKARCLLAVLLINAGRSVPVQRLVAELWPETVPPSACTLVRGYISSLRRQLGDSAARLLSTQAHSYRLDAKPGDIDAGRFGQLLNEGRCLLSQGEAPQAASVLQDALGLWQGSPLSDVPSAPTVDAHAARLEEQRLGALEARIEAQLMMPGGVVAGDAGLIGELREMLGLHPFRERLAGLLMLALHATGRRADALDVYSEVRHRLAGELGLDPGAELQRVHHEILTAAVEPVPAAPAAQPAPLSPDAYQTPMQTPPDIADFTGRGKPMRRCVDLLSRRDARALPVVVISGQGGVGKTALAVHLAHELRPGYPDGQLYADLGAGDVDLAQVLGRFLRAVGVPARAVPDDMQERIDLYRSVLRDRRVLVILDNVAGEGQVRALRPGSAGCAVLATSRSRLAGIEGASAVCLQPFDEAESLGLFLRIADSDRVAGELQSAVDIARLCGHLPLAVRIAAARFGARPGLSLARFAAALRDESRRLDELSIGDLAVRASIATSYRVLQPGQQRALRLISLLDGDFTENTVAALIAAPPANVERIVTALADAQLIGVTGDCGTGRPRYRLHDLVRLYARELAEAQHDPAELTAAARRALSALLGSVQHAAQRLPAHTMAAIALAPEAPAVPVTEDGPADPFAWFETERAGVQTAVAQASRTGEPLIAAGLAAAAHPFYELRGYYDEGLATHRVALAACRAAGERLAEAVLLRNLADLHSSRPGSSIDDKLTCAEAALAIFRSLGEGRGEADALYLCSDVHRVKGHPAQALACLEASRDAAASAGYALGERHVLLQLAMIRREQGSLDEAITAADRALDLARDANSARDQAVALGILGVAHREKLGFGPGDALLRQAIGIAEAAGDSLLEAFLRIHLGQSHAIQGLPDAREALESALAQAIALGSTFGQALALHALGEWEVGQGRAAEAVGRYRSATRLWEQIQARFPHAVTLESLGAALSVRGDRAAAREARLAASRLFRQVGNSVRVRHLRRLLEPPGQGSTAGCRCFV